MTLTADQGGDLLFLMRSPAYVRNFESVLRRLAVRGHRATVLFEERKDGGDGAGLALIRQLCADNESLGYELLPPLPRGVRGRLRMALEAGQDYLRYLESPYGDAGKLRSRALGFMPDGLEHALASALRRWRTGRRVLNSAARRVNRLLGDDRRVRSELERRRPRALIVTPLVQFRSRQADWVRAAHGLGIGTMVCVYSWDNLTNKGLMHALPDRIAVWNDAQRRQAIELHGAAAESIAVTGAWPYDHWFRWRVSRSRDELCKQLGLPGARAMILYACSSRFIVEHEPPAVARWVRALRSSPDPQIATANVIVRPHPLNGDEWSDRSLEDLPGVAVFPPGGTDPVDDSSRADYFDSIAHADAVVGINTSALIEGAIVGRPALAYPAPDFRASQEELPHFRELVGGQGLVKASASMTEHVVQLGEALTDASAEVAARRHSVEPFVRPRGGSSSPAECVVSAIEEVMEAGRVPRDRPIAGAVRMGS